MALSSSAPQRPHSVLELGRAAASVVAAQVSSGPAPRTATLSYSLLSDESPHKGGGARHSLAAGSCQRVLSGTALRHLKLPVLSEPGSIEQGPGGNICKHQC